jgi:hypothetical protein
MCVCVCVWGGGELTLGLPTLEEINSWIHSVPSPGDQSSIWSLSVRWDIFKEKKTYLTLAHHRKVKKISLNILSITFFWTQRLYKSIIMRTVWYFEEIGYKHKWQKLYFTQHQRTDSNGLVFKLCILHKIIARYIKSSACCRISGLFAICNKCSFYSVQDR